MENKQSISQEEAIDLEIQKVIPPHDALVKVFKYALKKDKPIKLDYLIPSFKKQAFVGHNTSKEIKLPNGSVICEKVLYKNTEEFTSPVSVIYKITKNDVKEKSTSKEHEVVNNYAMAETANTIYVISADIKATKITDNDLIDDEQSDEDED